MSISFPYGLATPSPTYGLLMVFCFCWHAVLTKMQDLIKNNCKQCLAVPIHMKMQSILTNLDYNTRLVLNRAIILIAYWLYMDCILIIYLQWFLLYLLVMSACELSAAGSSCHGPAYRFSQTWLLHEQQHTKLFTPRRDNGKGNIIDLFNTNRVY